ncbi:MAG: hypothetical protein B5M53_02785 [Candidatus Cloacimonas sp. 4484_209]|nr:MAG: hypothetical protein B5M53_02785 [Candidatus Cloacimonas sp. 4484_209]
MLIFIVMLLVASWLAYTQTRSKRIEYLEDKVQAFYNAESGLAKTLWYLSGNKAVNFNAELSGIRTKTDTLFDDTRSTVEITIKDRGFFTEVESKGKEGKYTETVKAKIGHNNQGIFTNACNVLSPGILHIRGNVEGNIETRGTVDGNLKGEVIQNLSLVFPEIDYCSVSDRIAQYRNFIENPSQADTELFSPLVINEEKDLPRKRLIYVNDVVLIENSDYSNPLKIKGNSMIVSPDEIQISGNVRLSGIDFIAYDRIFITDECVVKDAVLYSEREIEMRNNTQFEGTVLTKGSIKVCEDVNITGNSVLLSNSDRYKIQFDDRSNVNGIIILCPKVGLGKTVTSQVVVGEDVNIKGLIYSTTGVRLKGKVIGTVYTPTFIGRPLYPDTLNMNVLEGEIETMEDKNIVLPIIFRGLPQKLFGWEKE